MTTDRMLSYGVRQKVVQAAVMLMDRAGISVTETICGPGVIRLDVTIPPESDDPIGDALVNALNAQQENGPE